MDYPVLNEKALQNAIERIESADLRTVSIRQLEEYLKPLFSGYKLNAPRLEKGLRLYRGRICDKPRDVRGISYPPPETITKYGRLNDIGEPIFYAATARGVAFFELGTKAGDTMALSLWESTHEALLNHVGFTDECSRALNSSRDLAEIYDFVRDTKHFGDLNNFVHSYLASKFAIRVQTGEEYKYKLTVAIGRKLLMGSLINGLLYPTIAMSANADNTALKTTFFHSSVKFVSVEFVRVTEQTGTRYRFNILDSATRLDEKGNILWSGRRLRWVLRNKGEEVVMKSEGGAWVAYDADGNRIDPE